MSHDGHTHEMAAAAGGQKMPVTVLTGFLGSGKTTLMNHILNDQTHGLKFAVIENELGAVGVDDALIGVASKADAGEEDLVEMVNGCICCTVRGDLIEALKRLYKRKKKFDAVLIETTGLADPGPVVQTFFMDQELRTMFELDGVITVVDAKHIVKHLDTEAREKGAVNETVEQVAFADRLLLNKTDLVTPAELADVKAQISSINSSVEIIETQFSIVDPARLINIKGFDLSRITEMNPQFLDEDESSQRSPAEGECKLVLAVEGLTCGADVAGIEKLISQTKGVASVAVDLAVGQALIFYKDGESSDDTLKGLVFDMGFDVKVLDEEAADFTAVATLDCCAAGTCKPDCEITPEATGAMKAKVSAQTKHDRQISSVAFRIEGEVIVNRLQDLISTLLEEQGETLYRYKGVLAIAGKSEKFVFQGVHMMFTGTYMANMPWAEGEKREAKFVFIGKNLDHEMLREKFEQCFFEPPLRFNVGDKVEANTGTWTAGTIIKLWDDANPYRIKLEDGDGTEIWGPDDHDAFVRKPTVASRTRAALHAAAEVMGADESTGEGNSAK